MNAAKIIVCEVQSANDLPFPLYSVYSLSISLFLLYLLTFRSL